MPTIHFAQKQVREILFFNLNPYEMKRMFLTLCGVLFIGSTINASEEIVKLDCHGMVDTLMSNLVAAGAYDGICRKQSKIGTIYMILVMPLSLFFNFH